MKEPGETHDVWDKKLVGRRIAALRAVKGWSGAELVRIMGSPMTSQKLTNYETGRDMLPLHLAGRLCAVTGVTFDYIYQGRMGSLPGDLASEFAKVAKTGRQTAVKPG